MQSAQLRARAGSGLPDQNPCGKNQPSAYDDLHEREQEAGLEVPMTNEGDDDQFDPDDCIGQRESVVDVADKKRQRMQEASEESHQAGYKSTDDRTAAPRQRPIVREPLGEGHRDSRSNRRRQADQKNRARVVRCECGGEDGGERRNGAIHQPGESGLNDAQNEVSVLCGRGVLLRGSGGVLWHSFSG